MKNYAIILSAGSSTRFSGNIKKQFYKICDRPVLFYSLFSFNKAKHIDEIVLVTSKEDIERVKDFVKQYEFTKVNKIVVGGSSRQESVKHGLDAIESNEGKVLIHDAARPLVSERIIDELLVKLDSYDGATPAIKVVDTVVRVKDNELSSYEDRESLYRIQTPQAFKLDVIKYAHEMFLGQAKTDDSQLLKLLNKKVAIIEGEEKLKKITKLEDTNAIEAYIEKNEYLQN